MCRGRAEIYKLFLKDVAVTTDQSSAVCIKSVSACYQLYTKNLGGGKCNINIKEVLG